MAELGPCPSQLGSHLGIECIEPLWAVHAHDEHLPVTLGFDDGHAISPD
jgi:hypothetical protein